MKDSMNLLGDLVEDTMLEPVTITDILIDDDDDNIVNDYLNDIDSSKVNFFVEK